MTIYDNIADIIMTAIDNHQTPICDQKLFTQLDQAWTTKDSGRLLDVTRKIRAGHYRTIGDMNVKKTVYLDLTKIGQPT